ncbi:hypothetical protein BJ508DRAFT_415704 [Ascobolus immersus RN42]|uniref:Survival motor neuron Tudor domain-containing protein n=1 Tax=Ascobolus immersus RN42 TaxID=1160509 RepID=A0A3N4I1E6_ASCIM|nr:hypothetical protein BJ508DRAFT_415704 [Ascobolus immersus RN42]
MTGKPLSHREIWDDSTIVSSWEYLLNEYKKYHSIEATGGNLEAAVKEFAEKQDRTEKQPQDAQADTSAPTEAAPPAPPSEQVAVAEQQQDKDETMAEAEPVPVDTTTTAPPTSNGLAGSDHSEVQEQGPSTKAAVPQPPPFPFMPGTNLAENEEMKNLMMAWYYAGYYTGLHEGQQKAQQQSK